MKYVGELIKADVLNKNGRYYPAEELKRAIAEFNAKIPEGGAIGQMDYPTTGNPGIVELDKATHVTHSLSFDEKENAVFVEAKIISSGPYAAMVIEGLRDNTLAFAPSGVGNVLEGGIISDYTMMSVNIIPAKTKA